MQGAGVYLGAKPIKADWTHWARIGILVILMLFLSSMTLIWLEAILGKLGLSLGLRGYGDWPVLAQKWFLTGYYFINAEWRFVPFALGAAFWMTRKC